ncbi:MAG TPA: hypothetical protein PKA10_18760 [Selenomonadales bacterium]|nr:hypothetical protein [Selenomonadales bacterium]
MSLRQLFSPTLLRAGNLIIFDYLFTKMIKFAIILMEGSSVPRTEGIPEEEACEIEFLLKKQIAGAGSNVSDTVRQLNEQYGTADTPQTVTRQLKQGNIPFWKVRRIADVLGYEIVWRKK